MKEINNFLKHFHIDRDIDAVFTCSACYGFALVLSTRFADKKPVIMYAPIDNHFGTKIADRIYDITGDVTLKYNWEMWDFFGDELEKARIIRDCIMF